MWVAHVRPWGGLETHVRIESGVIAEYSPTIHADPHVPVVEGHGRLMFPSFSDVHVHLDMSRLGLPFRPHTAGPTIWSKVLNDRRHWREAETSIVQRATETLGKMIARGTTRVRSYAQVDVDCGLERLEAVMSARDAHRDRSDVEIIAFPQAGLLVEDGSVQVLEDALRAGADVVGGIDPCSLDRDPVRHLDTIFKLAEKYGLPIDVHLHEEGELGRFSADLIIDRIEAHGMQGLVTISHGYGLWTGGEAESRRLLERFVQGQVHSATVAPGNRQPLPLQAMVESGLRVGLGEDGQRDYWSPYGNADMLDRTWQLAFTNGFRDDALIEHCLAVATRGGESLLNADLPPLASIYDRPGLEVGDKADLILVSGDTPTAAVMDRPADRTVIHDGNVVADAFELVG